MVVCEQQLPFHVGHDLRHHGTSRSSLRLPVCRLALVTLRAVLEAVDAVTGSRYRAAFRNRRLPAFVGSE
jgi:hypothetical protein